MIQNRTDSINFECRAGTDPLIVAAIESSLPREKFFPQKISFAHGRLVESVLEDLRRKNPRQFQSLSLQQAATCPDLEAFSLDLENWCWVRFPKGEPFFLSFTRIERGGRVVWVVDEVVKRIDRYTPFGYQVIYGGTAERDKVREIELPPEKLAKTRTR